jgi:hypothetical protein
MAPTSRNEWFRSRFIMAIGILVALFAFLISRCYSAAISSNQVEIPSIYQFEAGTWVENIAVRSNGNLVLILYSKAEMWELNPLIPNPTPRLLHRFENANSLTGVVETSTDTFVTMVNRKTGFSISSVDLSGGGTPIVKEIIRDVVDAKALNGLTRLSSNILLAADTSVGGVFALDIVNGTSSLVIKDETMSGLLGLPAGINGVRVQGQLLYFTSFLKGIFARIPIDSATGKATGPADTVAKNLGLGLDDFAMGPGENDAYVMGYLQGEVIHVDIKSGTAKSVGKAAYPTSAQFGRARGDERTLYIISSGNPLNQVVGVFSGAKIYALKLQ